MQEISHIQTSRFLSTIQPMLGKRNSRRHVGAKPKASKPAVARPTSHSGEVSKDLLQHLLNVFSNTFSSHFEPGLPFLIRSVKQHLFNRDFLSAFGRDDLLVAYAIRWSPSRALAYTCILCSLPDLFARTVPVQDSSITKPEKEFRNDVAAQRFLRTNADTSIETEDKHTPTRVMCIGAGAGAEVVALGGLLNHSEHLSCHTQNSFKDKPLSGDLEARIQLDVTVIDIADCDAVVPRLHSSVLAAPPTSRYASVKIKAFSRPLANPSDYKLNVVKRDILDMEHADLTTTFRDTALVTIMFTLNELYSSSISSTTNLLLSLTTILSPGALLLVVDSPGSYSTIKLGTSTNGSNDGVDSKKYPMQWLLDHTMLESAATGSNNNATAGNAKWEKLQSQDSDWFRVPSELRYPIEIEDMRYQLHLYRRL